MDPLAFLQTILPDTGWYVAFALHPTAKYPSGLPKQRRETVGTVDELWTLLSKWNAEGWTCYHACAAFRDKRGIWNPHKSKFEVRCHENVDALASLYGDIDTCESHPNALYANRVEGARALAMFCNTVAIPYPLLVSSGGGLHPYWPLAEELTREEWQPLADALKAAMEANGLKKVERITDSASILRPVGTLHRKSGELVKVVYENEGLFEVAPFAQLRERYGTNTQTVRALAGPNAHGLPGLGFLGELRGVEYCNPRAIEQSCQQIAKLVNEPGAAPEHLHWLGAGVFGSIGPTGRDYYLEFQRAKYPQHSDAWCITKLDNWRGKNGVTCRKFREDLPDGCAGCPHTVSSPCYFARQWQGNGNNGPALQVPKGGGPGSAGGHGQLAPQTNGFHAAPTFVPTGTEIKIPLDDHGKVRWKVNQKGQLVRAQEKKDGTADELIICEHFVWLNAIYDGELKKNTQSLEFRVRLLNEPDKEVMIDAEAIKNGTGWGKLLNGQINIRAHDEFLAYFNAAHRDRSREIVMTRYEQCGWKENETEFLVGEILYKQYPDGSVGASNVKIARELEPRALQLGRLEGTDVRDWLGSVCQLWKPDHYAAWFLIYSSFAAPLMQLLDGSQGGVIVHTFCRESGKGKTTALKAAATVWGTWEGFVCQPNDTVTSKPLMLAEACNLPVVIDELVLMHDKDRPEIIRNFVHTVNLGGDKKRAEQTGKSIRPQAGRWCMIPISGSNNSLIDILESTSKGTDAPAMRVLEVPWPLIPFDTAAGAQLVADMIRNAGTAGDKFMRHLLKPDIMKWTRKALQDAYKELMSRLANEERFRAQAIACMYVAGCLLQQLGMAPAQPFEIVQWVVSKIKRGQATVVSNGAYQRTLEALSEFTSMHVNCTVRVSNAFVPGQPPMLIPVPPPRILMRYEAGGGRLMIATKAFREWIVGQGHSWQDVMDDLDESGVLVAQKKTAMCAGTTLTPVQQMCLAIDLNHPRLAGAIDVARAANDG